jgi:hypothetical protein
MRCRSAGRRAATCWRSARERPRYIVMAHRDSKSQPVPLAFRGPAIVLGVLVVAGAAARRRLSTPPSRCPAR